MGKWVNPGGRLAAGAAGSGVQRDFPGKDYSMTEIIPLCFVRLMSAIFHRINSCL